MFWFDGGLGCLSFVCDRRGGNRERKEMSELSTELYFLLLFLNGRKENSPKVQVIYSSPDGFPSARLFGWGGVVAGVDLSSCGEAFDGIGWWAVGRRGKQHLNGNLYLCGC